MTDPEPGELLDEVIDRLDELDRHLAAIRAWAMAMKQGDRDGGTNPGHG